MAPLAQLHAQVQGDLAERVRGQDDLRQGFAMRGVDGVDRGPAMLTRPPKAVPEGRPWLPGARAWPWLDHDLHAQQRHGCSSPVFDEDARSPSTERPKLES